MGVSGQHRAFLDLHRHESRHRAWPKAFRGALLLLMPAALAAACGGSNGAPIGSSGPSNNGADPAGDGKNQSPSPKPNVLSDVSFELVFPNGYGINATTVGANGDLTIGAGDQIMATDGSLGNAVNASSGGLIQVGAGVKAGKIASAGSIVFEADASASSAQAAGSVQLGPHAVVPNVQNGATVTPLVRRTVIVHPPANAPTNVQASGDTSLAPGAYGTVQVPENGNLTLSAGTYYVETFNAAPKSQIHLDTAHGTVNLWVHGTATWGGTVSGDASRFVMGYLGQDKVVLQGGFQGTALAPFGTLELAAAPSPYKGTFYGKHVVLDPNVSVREAPTPYLIDQLSVGKTTLCVGEQTELSLVASAAGPDAVVNLQGLRGTHQYVQFANNAGQRSVFASVYSPDGRADFTSIPVTVQTCPAGASQAGGAPVALHFWGAKAPANTVEFVVRGFDGDGHETGMTGQASYAWTFGDGQTATTTTPAISHDYTAGMNPLNEHSFFEAQVTVTTPSGSSTSKKVVPVWSLYARNRAKGIVQAPAKVLSTGKNVAMSLTNYESTPLTMQSARVDLMPCDPSLPAIPQPEQALSGTVGATTSGTVNVVSPKSYGKDICGMAVHVKGTSAVGTVYSDAYQSVRENPLHRQPVTDGNTAALLNQAAAALGNPARINESDLRQLVASGQISRMPPSVAPAGAVSPSVISASADLGDECTPGDTDPTGGRVCSPTADWVVNPPQILNAYKGDIFVDHGCGRIGQLLGAIGQHYSHSILFTKNHSEIRHSTGSETRMSDAVQYTQARLDPDKIRYGFPGTDGFKTHTIDEMVNYYCVADPDGNGGSTSERGCEGDDSGFCKCPKGSWLLSGEINPDPVRCDGDYTAVPALIVRPPPWDAAAIQRAEATADQSMTISGHYRFFMYSHTDEPSTAGPEGGWANGTLSTVCSSFITMSAAKAGAPMRPTNPGVPDGMREYSVDTRLTAGNELYANTTNSVNEACSVTPEGGAKLGGAIGLIGGPIGVAIGAGIGAAAGEYCKTLADNISNQMANCFGSDACDDTGPTWRNPGTGVAVSPDDLLAWDTPDHGGTWGYNEPASYAPVSFRHKYVWAAPGGTGSMTVHVVDADGVTPVAGATVLLNDGLVGGTDASGQLHLPARYAGSYYLAAQLNQCTSTGGVSLPPQPPPPSLDSVPNLPLCAGIGVSGATACQYPMYPGNQRCPAGWLDVQSYPAPGNQCVLDPSGATAQVQAGDGTITTVPQYLCACVAPPPACSQVHPLESGATPTKVVAGQDDAVTIRLCNGGLQWQGSHQVPQSCPQSCTVDSNCDTGMVCRGNFCTPGPRKVQISSTSLDIQTYGYNWGSPKRTQFHPTINMICTPGANGAQGWAHYETCSDDGSNNKNFFVLDVNCAQGTDSGITLNAWAKLLDGCGSSATDQKDTLFFTSGIAPFSSGNPTPTTDYGAPNNQAYTCYGDPGHCDENSAQFSLRFISEQAP